MVSLQDVAAAAGVSKTTASFVLNGRSRSMKISEQTAEKVRRAARELGYVPNMAAKRLTAGRGNQRVLPEIALVWFPKSRPAWYGPFISSAFDLFATHEHLRMNLVSFSFTPEQLQTLEHTILSKDFHGILISPEHGTDLRFLNCIPPETAVVVLHVVSDKHASVIMDYYGVGELAARVFAKKGYSDVGMVYYPHLGKTADPDPRFLAFRDVCTEAGMPLQAYPIDGTSSDSKADRVRFGKQLAEQLIEGNRLPRGLFIQNDCIATAFLTTLLSHGIRVPEDVELITYGDDDLAGAVCPSITTIDYPQDGITLEALKLLKQQFTEPLTTAVCVKVPPTVTFRDSCPCPEGWE